MIKGRLLLLGFGIRLELNTEMFGKLIKLIY